MEYEEVRVLKESGRGTVSLVRGTGSGRLYVRKTLRGKHPAYDVLKELRHPGIPVIEEVVSEADGVTVIEEYVEGDTLGSRELGGRERRTVIRELCGVLQFLHEHQIIHRDIKPSNIILARDGHLKLIDFETARIPKDDVEQDTSLLGTRGYAPPEQYGFAQTDQRTDIYALGAVLRQLLGRDADKPRYRAVIGKCMNLDPDRRYQSAKQVWRALSGLRGKILCGAAVLAVLGACLLAVYCRGAAGKDAVLAASGIEREAALQDALKTLPAPEDPHWDGESGIALCGNVPESGRGGQVYYNYRVYRCDTDVPPDPALASQYYECGMGGNFGVNESTGYYETNLVPAFSTNGYYYFAVSAVGDGVTYADSPYALSDAFHYTGEDAPALPTPAGLRWNVLPDEMGYEYFASWDNLDDYADEDIFNVSFYDGEGTLVTNNTWSKKDILSVGGSGIWFDWQNAGDGSYRFTVEVYTSRPNEYRSCYVSAPAPEEAYSPWLEIGK